MSYHDLPTGNANRELGRKIYMDVLDGRRGFRYDQLGIEDHEIWAEIFEEIGSVARAAVAAQERGWKMSDIVDRLRFDATRCALQFSKGVAGNITEAADEIERLRRVLENIKGGHSADPQLDAIRALGQGRIP